MDLCIKIGGFLKAGCVAAIAVGIAWATFSQIESVAKTNDYQRREMPIAGSAPLPVKWTGWKVQCTSPPGEYECRAERSLYRTLGRSLVTVVVRVGQGKMQPLMRLTLPHSIYVPEGVTLRVGGAPAKWLEVQYCVKSGCLVEATITKPEITDMLKGKRLRIWIHDQKGKTVSFRIPAAGFDKAYPKMN